MRAKLLSAALAGAMLLAGCETTGYGYGPQPRQTQLSQCMRNALIGAGVGAVVGAATAPDKNRGENAAIGAAVGGLGTYGACRFLSAREQQRIENSYYQSLNTGAPVNQSWTTDQGQQRSLSVAAPAPAGPECRTVNATVTDSQNGAQALPAERFCRGADGAWRPA